MFDSLDGVLARVHQDADLLKDVMENVERADADEAPRPTVLHDRIPNFTSQDSDVEIIPNFTSRNYRGVSSGRKAYSESPQLFQRSVSHTFVMEVADDSDEADSVILPRNDPSKGSKSTGTKRARSTEADSAPRKRQRRRLRGSVKDTAQSFGALWPKLKEKGWNYFRRWPS